MTIVAAQTDITALCGSFGRLQITSRGYGIVVIPGRWQSGMLAWHSCLSLLCLVRPGPAIAK